MVWRALACKQGYTFVFNSSLPLDVRVSLIPAPGSTCLCRPRCQISRATAASCTVLDMRVHADGYCTHRELDRCAKLALLSTKNSPLLVLDHSGCVNKESLALSSSKHVTSISNGQQPSAFRSLNGVSSAQKGQRQIPATLGTLRYLDLSIKREMS